MWEVRWDRDGVWVLGGVELEVWVGMRVGCKMWGRNGMGLERVWVCVVVGMWKVGGGGGVSLGGV